MNADQREAEIRRRVFRWLAHPRDAHMAQEGSDYADLADQAFLLELVDELRRQLAHPAHNRAAPAPTPAYPTPPTALMALGALPAADPRCDAAWNGALAQAITHGEGALVQAMREGLNPYETRARLTAALNALRHDPPAVLPRAPAPPPPAEPPPFTAG